MRIIERDKEKIAHCERLLTEARDLHLGPSVLATYGVDHFDKNGKQILKETGKSNSFVRNYYNLLATNALFWPTQGTNFGAGTETPLKDYLGNVITGYMSSYPQYLTGAVVGNYRAGTSTSVTIGARADMYQAFQNAGTDAAKHIVVGLADTAESFESVDLGNRITHGTGENQLQFGAPPNASALYDSGTNKLTVVHSRTFTNASAAAVTIKEIGLMSQIAVQSQDYVNRYLLIRDVLATPIVLEVGQTLTISYNLSYIMSN